MKSLPMCRPDGGNEGYCVAAPSRKPLAHTRAHAQRQLVRAHRRLRLVRRSNGAAEAGVLAAGEQLPAYRNRRAWQRRDLQVVREDDARLVMIEG